MSRRIGFIGAGLMGHGMAKNIVDKDYPLTVLGHRNRQPIEDLLRRGASEAGTPAALARASDILILCVPPPTRSSSACSPRTASSPARMKV